MSEMTIKFQVVYNGKIIGYENASSEADALNRLVASNPHHLSDRFSLTALTPVMQKGAVVAHRT